MSELNSDLNQNNSKLQIAHQANSPVSDSKEKLSLETFKNDSDWNVTPAELYGCLCHTRA